MGEASKQGCMIVLVKHITWADSLYFLYMLLLSFLTWFHPRLPYGPPDRHVGLILIFLEDYLKLCLYYTEVCLFS
jgi:hypothetical protein